MCDFHAVHHSTAAAKQRAVMHEVDLGAMCTSCDNCPGFELHFWRKHCKHCKCAREDHDVDYVPGMNRPRAKFIGCEPVPEEPATKQDDNVKPEPEIEETPVEPPRALTKEERKRLAHQDPVHDHDPDACSSLNDENQIKSFERLNLKRNEMYGVGQAKHIEVPEEPPRFCHRSGDQIKKGDDVVEARLDGKDVVYLRDNFTCNNCGCPLCEYRYYEYENEVYCGRCHAEKFMPRCAGCDELIFDPTYTVAEGQKWHVVHFCCWVCDIDLCEKQYAKDSDGNPCCLPCYNDKYAVKCGTCEKLITAGERAMRAGDQSYHDSPDCFQCKVCESSLKDKKCVQYQGGLYCSGCYHDVHSPPCGRCGERVKGEFVEVRGVRYKKSCFNCYECGVVFTREEKKGAYPIGGKLLCYTHALETRRKELKEAKAKEAAKAEAEAKRASVAATNTESPASPQESKLATPNVTVSADAADDVVEGGKEIKAQPSRREMVRSGTKRVSRMRRAPSVNKVSRDQQAATAAAIKEAGASDESGNETADAADDIEVNPHAKIDEAPTDAKQVAVSPSKAEGTKKPDPAVEEDPFAELWAGFVIPMKLSKFVLDRPGRTAIDIAPFILIQKRVKAHVFLVLCTDVAMLVQKVEDGCYELMFMPVERSKVKAKIVKSPPNSIQVKMGKKVILKAKDDVMRSLWVGKLNAPIGFVPTKELENLPSARDSAFLF